MGAPSASAVPHAGSRTAAAAGTEAERRTRVLKPAAAAPGKLQGPLLLAPRAPGRAARTATATPGSVRQTTAAASWCEVSGPLAALAHRIPPLALRLPPPPNSRTQPVSHHSVIHSASIILSVYCVLNVELSAGDKAANGTKEIPVSLPYISQPLGPAAHPRPIPAGDGGGGTDASAGCREPVPAPRPKRRHERSVGSGQGGTRVRNPGRKRPALRSEARFRLRRRPHRLLAGECTRARSAGCAALARLGFALSAPTSSRRPGPAGSRCGLLPAWPSAALPFSLALGPPLFFPGLFSLPSAPQPSFPASASGLCPSTRLCLASSLRGRDFPDP